MTRFEPRISDVGSDRSTNWATTTALNRFNNLRLHNKRFHAARAFHLDSTFSRFEAEKNGKQKLIILQFVNKLSLMCWKSVEKYWQRFKTIYKLLYFSTGLVVSSLCNFYNWFQLNKPSSIYSITYGCTYPALEAPRSWRPCSWSMCTDSHPSWSRGRWDTCTWSPLLRTTSSHRSWSRVGPVGKVKLLKRDDWGRCH